MTRTPRSVLVTGGAGFIGSNLVHRLAAQGDRVTVVDVFASGSGANRGNLDGLERSGVTLLEEDLSRSGSWEATLREVDTVFHLASQTGHGASMDDPLRDLSSNALATLRVLEAVRAEPEPPRVVFTSTRQVYGRPEGLPVAESHPIAPPDVNAVHKLAAEEYLRVFGRAYGIEGVILRLTNTYGPRMRVVDGRQTFVGLWIRQALAGGDVTVYGDGEQVRDLTYVDDVVDALLAAEGCSGSDVPTFNIGGHPTSLADLANLVVSVAGTGTRRMVPFPEHLARIDIGSYVADDRAFRGSTGWFPSVDLANGLRACIAFLRDNRALYIDDSL